MDSAEDASARHTVPVIDRMMEVLGVLEASAASLTIREITVPPTSAYRIPNTLQQHEVVRRDDRGGYHLGRTRLAGRPHRRRGGQPAVPRRAGRGPGRGG